MTIHMSGQLKVSGSASSCELRKNKKIKIEAVKQLI